MNHARYLVIPHEGLWKINFNNQYYGPFTTREAAVAMAVETAGKAAADGHPTAEVLEMTGPGAFTKLWSWAEDGKAKG